MISEGIRWINKINNLASYCIFSGPTNESSLWKEAKSSEVAEEKRKKGDWNEGIIGKNFVTKVNIL